MKHPAICDCGGEGWLWGHELVQSEETPTDTRYLCDREWPRHPQDVDRIASLEAALRSPIDRIRRTGGYATPEEQDVLWRAEEVLKGVS